MGLTFKNEPDGFRGIKWGTDISTLQIKEDKKQKANSGMIYNEYPQYPGEGIGRKVNEKLQLGGAVLCAIFYHFYKHKFDMVKLNTDTLVSFDALKDAVFVKFGIGDQPNKHKEEWYWSGEVTNMTLQYIRSSQKGVLFMRSNKIALQREEDDKQKSKEGAEKGF